MKIPDDSNVAFVVATYFAEKLHAQLVTLQIIGSGTDTDLGYLKKDIAELRPILRSIKNPLDRKAFIIQLRYLFKRAREERRSYPTTRDHVLGCLRFNWPHRKGEFTRRMIKRCVNHLRRYQPSRPLRPSVHSLEASHA